MYNKYIKYKKKYLELKNKQIGGAYGDLPDELLENTLNQINNCKDIIKFASKNQKARLLAKNRLHRIYPRLRESNPFLPNIENITWEQFVNFCHIINRAENFLNNDMGRLTAVPVGNDHIDMTNVNIDLEGRNYTDDDLRLFFSLLLYVDNLERLNLKGNQITDITHLENAFVNNLNLTSLDLSNNQIIDITSLENAFKNNPNLTSLDLSNNQITDITSLENAFTSNSNLEDLELSHNQINDITPLQNSFLNNQNLFYLNLGNNQIKNIAPLQNIFLRLPNFDSLFLNDNQIIDITPLQNSFVNNPDLLQINLSNNKIIDITSFENSFVNKPNLQVIDFRNNPIHNQIQVGNINILY